MSAILIVVEDSSAAQLLSEKIGQQLEHQALYATSIEAAKKTIKSQTETVSLVILDIQLSPDNYAPFGEIPTIIISGQISVLSNKIVQAKTVIDYVANLENHNVQYIIQLIKRMKYAQKIKVLLVDDELLTRRLIGNLLNNKGIQVLDASNGKDALLILQENPDIKLVIIDYSMPHMNGFELTHKIRAHFTKSELPIIGYSGVESRDLPASFMMHGANDFIAKPFSLEEFNIRVMQNIQIAETFQELREASNRDFLTNLYNRRYFFEIGQKFFESARRGHIDILVAMIDIDHFKAINDRFGHAMGDSALIALANILKNNLRNSDIIARFGGEEFCILSTGIKMKDGSTVFNRIRELVENHTIFTPIGELTFTMSVGLCGHNYNSLSEIVAKADELLYQAKGTGRNRVVCEL